MKLRPYRPSDLDALLTLFTDSVRRVARRDYTEAQTHAWAPDCPDRVAWATRLRDSETLVAEEQGVIVGFATWMVNGHIDLLYVHADHQRRGIASGLLAAIEGEARARKLARLFTGASMTAQPLFEQRGFRVIAPQSVVLREEMFVNFWMEKVLS